MAAIEAVIFDCDGTLVDSEPLAGAALSTSLALLGVALSAEEATRRYRGSKMADCLADVERRLGRQLPATFLTDLRARIAAAFKTDLKAMPGADQALAAVKLPKCVASSGPPDKIQLSLQITGLERFFAHDRIFSAYDIGAWKPDPKLFLHAATHMGIAPCRCAVIEDSPIGVQAGINAKMRTFWFRPDDPVPESVTPLAQLADLPSLLV